jgi:hypothetical protein
MIQFLLMVMSFAHSANTLPVAPLQIYPIDTLQPIQSLHTREPFYFASTLEKNSQRDNSRIVPRRKWVPLPIAKMILRKAFRLKPAGAPEEDSSKKKKLSFGRILLIILGACLLFLIIYMIANPIMIL